MAHNISINEETGKASLFVVKEPAWHGLGQVVPNALNAEEAIVAAGLDWEVEKTIGQYTFNGEVKNMKSTYATVRKDNGVALGTVGSGYTIVQNKDAFGFFDHLVNEKEAIYHSAGALGDGERIWLLAKLPTDIVIGKVDLIENYALVYNSHDGSGAVTAALTNVRVVCNNTLTAALKGTQNKVTVRHTANVADRLKEAHKVLGIYNKYRVELEAALNVFATKNVNRELADLYLSKIYDSVDSEGKIVEAGKKNKQAILEVFESNVGGQDSPTCRGTLYGLYNATTFYYDNVVNYAGAQEKANSVWFGNSAAMREWSFKKALELVTV